MDRTEVLHAQSYDISGMQKNTPGQNEFVISSEKLFSNEVIGDTADGPSGHIVVIFGGQSSPGEMLSQISINKLMSESLPLPLAILSKIISSHVVPSRHGVH